MIKVTLRSKKISKGRETLYLDYYPAVKDALTGKQSRRDFLGLYVFQKPKSEAERVHNKDTRIMAEHKRNLKYNEVNKPEIYTDFELSQMRQKELGKQSFVEYFQTLSNKRRASNHDNWVSAAHYLEAFTGGQLIFSELTEKFCNEFRDYLLTSPQILDRNKSISQNSALSYFNKFKAALKQAYKDGFLLENLNAKIECIKPKETRRNFLTLEELNNLVRTECEIPLLKRASLFSALTGLRFSDIQLLKWNQIELIKGEGYFISFTQQKTKGVEMQPISEPAYQLLGEQGKADDLVFSGLIYSTDNNKKLSSWIKDAGISKHITFHCFRHSYATLLISKGIDLYTVSKLLGHREIKTTQVYAKVLDSAKREAANKMQFNLPSL